MKSFAGTSFPLGLGTAKLRSLEGGLSARAAERLLMQAFDSGMRFIDTAPLYGQGQAESSIGKLPACVRNELVICTKVGTGHGRKATLINALKPALRPLFRSVGYLRDFVRQSRRRLVDRGGVLVEIRPDSIRASVAESRRQLRRERIDLLLLHQATLASLDEENLRTLEQLTATGDIGGWGVSTWEPETALRAASVPGIAAVEVPVEPEWVAEAADVFLACQARGIPVIGNRVLAPLQKQAEHGIDERVLQQEIAACFAFALVQPGVRIVLCGTTNGRHLDMNVRAMRSALETVAERSLCRR